MVDLDVLEALAKAATPGPWETDSYEEGMVTVQQDSADTEALCIADLGQLTDRPDENGDYIAAVSPDVVLALIAELREARKAQP